MSDVDDARASTAKTTDTATPKILAIVITLGFFAVLAYLLANGKPEVGGDVLLVMLGSLGTAWTQIVAYFFGSSAGSKAKTALLAKAGK